MPRRVWCAALGLAVSLAWCGHPRPSAVAQDRPPASSSPTPAPSLYVAMFGGDARHTGRVSARGPHTPPSIAWRVRTRRRVFASPVIDSRGRAVFASLDGEVLGVDRDGIVRWGFGAPDRVFSAPAVVGLVTVFGHDGDAFVGVDGRGLLAWSHPVSEDADAPPVVGPDGTIYAASRGVTALDARGERKWTRALQGHVFGAPALAPDGNLYVPELSGAVSVVRARDGEIVRRITLAAGVYGGVLVLDDGDFVVATDDGHVRALHPDGSARWDFTTQGAARGQGVRATPALGRDGTVIVGAEDGGVYGLRVATGEQVFRVQTFGPVRSSARIDVDGWVFVGSEDDTLRGLDPSGNVMWQVALGADIDTSPAIMPDGTLVAGCDDGALYGLR